MRRDIQNKKIKLFVENGVDKYRRNDKITLKEMIKIYLENYGFFILANDKLDLIEYLDMVDLPMIRKIIGKMEGNNSEYDGNKPLSELIKKQLIKFRNETINADMKLIDVLRRLDNSEQNYFPVVENGILLGRVSKRILKEKLDEIY